MPGCISVHCVSIPRHTLDLQITLWLPPERLTYPDHLTSTWVGVIDHYQDHQKWLDLLEQIFQTTWHHYSDHLTSDWWPSWTYPRAKNEGLIMVKNVLFTIRTLNFLSSLEYFYSVVFAIYVPNLQTLILLNKSLSFLSSQNLQTLFEFIWQVLS